MEVCLIYNSTLFSGVQHNNSVFLQIALHYKLPKDNDYSSLCYTICPCCLSLSYFLKYIHTHPFLLSISVNCPFPGSIVTPLTTPNGVTLSLSLCFVGVQLVSYVLFFVTPWTEACHAFLSFTISQSLLKLMSIESVRPSKHLILCPPLLLLPSIFPSIGLFSRCWVSLSLSIYIIYSTSYISRVLSDLHV